MSTGAATQYLKMREHLSAWPLVGRLLRSRASSAVRKAARAIDRTVLRLYPVERRLQQEFNDWARRGAGASMEGDHFWFAEKTLDQMALSSAQTILDLGCGDGWAARLVSSRLHERGYVLGIDISDEMIREARNKSRKHHNVDFVCGSAERIPCSDNTFNTVLSISAFYYFPRQAAVLKELLRVIRPDGRVFLLTCLYKDLPDWRTSKAWLRVPVHVCTSAEYQAMFSAAGWVDIAAQEFRRDKCADGHDRALLITARRPSSEETLAYRPRCLVKRSSFAALPKLAFLRSAMSGGCKKPHPRSDPQRSVPEL